MNNKSLFARFLSQPLSICLGEIWLVFAIFVLAVHAPLFTFMFVTFLVTVYLITYFITGWE